MAEFALGLTKTAVAGTVSGVKSAIEEEAKLRVRVQNDLMFITGEFEMMQAFLSTSRARESASKDKVVRTWVRQLRDLAFDVEDCVEFIIHLDNKSPWTWLWRVVPSCMAPPRHLDQAVAEIKLLKERVEDVSQRNTRYKLFTSGDGGSGDDSDQQLLRQTVVSSTSSTEESTFHILRKVWEDAGKLHDNVNTDDLKRLIDFQGDKLQVISLWDSPQADAAGELEWTAIVKKAYDDIETCQEFKNRAWIKLAHPFNQVEFLNTLLTHFTPGLQHQHHDDMSELVRQVREHRYLIVLEQELASVADWEAIRPCLPDGDNGSRIIVATRHLGIAIACTSESYQVWELERFFRGKYLYAFSPKGSNHRVGMGHRGRGDQGGSIKENVEFKLVGREHVSWDHLMYVVSNPLNMTKHVSWDSTGYGTRSVWGIPGVGKSAFVREKYKNHTIKYRMHGWVDVPHPFNLIHFCWRLLLGFYLDDVEAKEVAAIAMMEGQDPALWCRKILREEKILLVFDGLESKHDWDLIEATLLPQPISVGTTIVIITREESIATHCTKVKDHILNLTCLEAGAATDLLKKIAFDGKQLSSPEEDIVNLITSQCGGLPEIITAVGGEFRRRGSVGMADFAYINANFMDVLEEMPGLRSLFCWVQSYFDACSDELKPCIFYMLVFPPNQSIRRKRLQRRWFAEGYSRDSSGGGATSELMGEKLFSELMELSMLYQENGTTKVNGFFHGYIKSRPMEDNLVFALEGHCSPSWRLTGKHLTISNNWDRDEAVFNSIDLSRLRSLTVFGEWKSFLTSEKMKMLRVLDLEGTNTSNYTSVTDDDLEEIAKLLHRLKFMSLRGCQKITRLPDSLGDMRQLETLDVRYTSVVELPPAIITKLHKLQYIRAGTSTDTSLLLLQTKASPLPPPPPPPTPPPQENVEDAEEEEVEEDAEEEEVEEAASQPSPTPPPPPPSTPSPTLPQQDSCGSVSLLLRGTTAESMAQLASTRITKAWKRKARDLVISNHNKWWKLKNRMNLGKRRRVAANGGGVEVGHAAAEGIGRMTALHTLGVVNVAGGKGAFLLLKELKKLTQLRKLALTGINRENWSRLCEAISGNLHHLESLSLQLLLLKEDGDSYHFACLDNNNMPEPPKSLKHLKVLYTTTGVRVAHAARIGRDWVKQLPNIKRLSHELTISSEEDIVQMVQLAVTWQFSLCAFRIKPIEQHLSFVCPEGVGSGCFLEPVSLRIECSSTLLQSTVTLERWISPLVKAISIHCCCCRFSAGSSLGCTLKVARLDEFMDLKEVTVTGTYAKQLKQDLSEQFNNWKTKPVFK